jgi:hypothetical protein
MKLQLAHDPCLEWRLELAADLRECMARGENPVPLLMNAYLRLPSCACGSGECERFISCLLQHLRSKTPSLALA